MSATTTTLVRATLQELGPEPNDPKPVPGTSPITVQFNPTSLRLQLANNVDGKKAFGRPATQVEGTSSATLTFDLIFDTAEQGETGTPRDVRELTRLVERFLLPAKGARGAKAVPPRVLFRWGPQNAAAFELVGIMTGLNQDFDLFSSTGVPLRAKLAVTIREQRPEFDTGRTGPGSNTGSAARDPDRRVAGAGTGLTDRESAAGSPPRDRSAPAVAGESAADFADRVGLDPSDWKALDLGRLDPLRLPPGLDIPFPAATALEIGRTAGISVGAGVDAPSVRPGETPDPVAVTAAGGVSRVLDRERDQRARAAADAARSVTPAPARPAPVRPDASGAGGTARPDPRPIDPPPVRPDPRASTFGFGVPLRERSAFSASGPAPVDDDPTRPGWEALRPAAARSAARGSGARHGGCGCGGGTRCR